MSVLKIICTFVEKYYGKLKTRVEFDVQLFKGKETIVGVATNGKSHIISPDEKLKSNIYGYTYFVAWEYQFKVIS